MLELPTIITPLKPSFGRKLRIGHWSTDGLVGYWPFREAINLVDYSPYKSHGTITGAVWGLGGVVFQDNTNQFIATPSTTLYNGSTMTVIVRFKANAVGPGPLHGADTIVQRYHPAGLGWKLGIDDAGYAVWLHYLVGQLADNAVGTVNLVGDWHTMAGVRTATNLFLYVDGVLVGQKEVTSDDLTASQPIEWGRWKDVALGSTLDGVISDTKFYNRGLPASEIQQLDEKPDLPLEPEKFYFPVAVAAPTSYNVSVIDTITVAETIIPVRTGGLVAEASVLDTISIAETLTNKLPLLYKYMVDTISVVETQIVTRLTYKLEGVTKDNSGSVLANCECFLCKDNGDDTISFVAHDQSDGTGNYSFTAMIDHDAKYFIIAWKDDSPHVFDITDHVLEPVVE